MSGHILHTDQTRVIIATTESDNRKTGNMIQIWILRHDMSPPDAVRTGADSEICGDCKLRGTDGWQGRTCYVNVAQGPNAVYRAYKAGRYDYLPRSRYPDVFSGRAVRFGAYGDPVHIPLGIVRYICFFAHRWTGYTHQWRRMPAYREYLMASVDSPLERQEANELGWRTFRVRDGMASLMAHEIACPAADETGHKTTCERCGLCNGARNGRAIDRRADIAIIVHGIGRNNLIQIGA